MKGLSLAVLFALSPALYAQQVLENIRSWGYQLENYCPDEEEWVFDETCEGESCPPIDVKVACINPGNAFEKMKASSNTLWIIDPTLANIDDTTGLGASGFKKQINWTREQIDAIKANGNMVIAYVNIGQAGKEEHYFDALPKEIVGKKDGEYAEDFDANFWIQEWQDIFVKDTTKYGKSYLGRLMDQGFDGVFLDRVDRYETVKSNELKQRANDMAAFVRSISTTAKAMNSNFKILFQNALSLADAAKDGGALSNPKEDFYKYTDAQVIESLFFDGKANPGVKDLNKGDAVYEKAQVKLITNNYGLPIFNVEYIYQPGSAKYGQNKSSYSSSLRTNFGEVNKFYPLFAAPATTRALNGEMERVSK